MSRLSNQHFTVLIGLFLTIPVIISANTARCDVTHCNSAPTEPGTELQYDFKKNLTKNPTCPCGKISIMCNGIPKEDILYLIKELQKNCVALQLAFQTINDYKIQIQEEYDDPTNDPVVKYMNEYNSYPWDMDTWTEETHFETYNYTIIQIPVFRTFILRHDQLVRKDGSGFNLLFVLTYYSPYKIPKECFLFDRPTMASAVYAQQMLDFERSGLISYNPDRTWFKLNSVIYDALLWMTAQTRGMSFREHKVKVAKLFLQGCIESQIQKNDRIEDELLEQAKIITKHMGQMSESLIQIREAHKFGTYISERLLFTKQYKELLDFSRTLMEEEKAGADGDESDDLKDLSSIIKLESKLDALAELMKKRPMTKTRSFI